MNDALSRGKALLMLHFPHFCAAAVASTPPTKTAQQAPKRPAIVQKWPVSVNNMAASGYRAEITPVFTGYRADKNRLSCRRRRRKPLSELAKMTFPQRVTRAQIYTLFIIKR